MADLLEYMATRQAPRFRAEPRYFPDGDHVSYFVRSDLYYGLRIDETLTLYLSEDSDELVGCKIKGVQRLLKEIGSFSVSVADAEGKIQLGLLFLTAATLADLAHRHRYVAAAQQLGSALLDAFALRQAA